MSRSTNRRYPKYIKEFECIGGECEDSCCVGWDIDIDKATFKKYHKVQDKEMKLMFQKNVHNKENYESDDIDYGKVKIKGEKRCPFLDEKNYCVIYSKLGEDYLSNVCTSFPRIMNKVDGIYEISLDVSCPEAARLILLKEEGIKFEEGDFTLDKHIVSSDIDTKSKAFNSSPIKYFKEIRDLSIKIIQNRKFDLNERLYILGEFINSLEEELEEDFKNVPKFIKSYNMNSVMDDYEKNDVSYIVQMDFFKKMLDKLNVEKSVDSVVFKEHTKEIISGFNFAESKGNIENAEQYIKAFEDYNEEFINKNSYIFENYLVNSMYNNMFPFSETESIFHGYMMLLIRYSYIRFYLVGKYLHNKEESKEEIVKFIQVFSKIVGHHKTYLANMLTYIKRNEFDNLEYAKLFLPK